MTPFKPPAKNGAGGDWREEYREMMGKPYDKKTELIDKKLEQFIEKVVQEQWYGIEGNIERVQKEAREGYEEELREKIGEIKFRKKDQMENVKDYVNRKIGFDKTIQNILKLIK